MTVSLQTAKQYLRVDSSDEDALIESLTASAERLCKDILRIPDDEELSESPMVEAAVLYGLAYLFEHREEADHKALVDNLRWILGAERKEVF